MTNEIKVSFDAKTRRLVMSAPFHLNDAIRGFPSRRFEPKSKTWRVPLVRANVNHLESVRHLYPFQFDAAAERAFKASEALTSVPVSVPFPFQYRFTDSKVKYTPMEHQTRMLDGAWGLKAVAWIAKMGCVSGDTELQTLFATGKGRRITIEKLWQLGRTGRTRCRTFKVDHFGQHDIIEVIRSGVKETWQLVLSDSKTLRATADHKILTDRGYVCLGDLNPGDMVVTHGGEFEYTTDTAPIEVEGPARRSIDKDGYVRVKTREHPNAWSASHYVYEHRLVMERKIGRYLTADEHVHHINGVRHDNRIENLELLNKTDHLRHHDYHKNFKGVKPSLSRVVSVVRHGMEMTYDISMEHPYHNYLANGIVVHNTGKTYAAIHLAFARWLAGQIDAVMVICPSTLRPTWRKEFEKFATREYDFRVHETKASWLKEFYNEKPKDRLQVLAVSVEGLGVSEALYDSACGFMVGRRVMVVCDESSRIKNPDAKRTNRAISIGSVAEYKMILNGTPIALGIEDLWSQYEFIDPNIIGCGDYWAYKTRYLQMGGFENKQIVGYMNTDELMSAIRPYTIEVGKEVLNLPPKMMKPMYCEATAEQKRLFKLIVKGANGDPNAPLIKVENVLERMLRLRQVTGGYLPKGKVVEKEVDGMLVETIETTIEPLEQNPKLDLLLSVVDDNFKTSKFIIWSTFVHEIEHLRDVLAQKYGEASVECYYGKTQIEDRSRIEDRYCKDPYLRFFIGNPVAAGLGLTLISGEDDVMVYYSGTNAYIDRAQSEDRSHRIGQKRSVTVIDLVMERTVDVVIQESIQMKMGIDEFVTAQLRAGIDITSNLLG